MNRFDLSKETRNPSSRRFLRRLCFLGLAPCVLVFWCAFSTAADGSVSEEILDILKDKGDISDQQHREMKEKAAKEKKGLEKACNRRFYWSNGFNLDSKDKKFKLQFGGRIVLDGAFLTAGDPQETGWRTEVRSARLFFSGTVYENIYFKAQYEFAGDEFVLTF